jgi:predicted site-specific integrase-resolvase
MQVKHLNQTEVAQRWSVSPRTLERWRWIGQGPRFLKVGRRVVYRIEDIEAYEAEQLRTSTLPPEPRAQAGAR